MEPRPRVRRPLLIEREGRSGVKEMSHCHPHNPGIVCHDRATAVRAGIFFWDMRIGGYICTDLPTRTASFRAKYYNLDEHEGEHYRLEICPWCGMQLPELFPDSREMSCADGDSD